MSHQNEIDEMLLALRKNNIYATNDFEKDLVKLVNVNTKKFIKVFYKDIRRSNYHEFNRFEILKLTAKQKKLIKGNNLYRYEYRENSNLKCIYIIEEENNNEEKILLCAFIEDGDKSKGKNSYKDNIDRAIRIYLNTKSKGGDKIGNRS